MFCRKILNFLNRSKNKSFLIIPRPALFVLRLYLTYSFILGNDYLGAAAHVMTFTMNNYHDQNDPKLAKALAWEKVYLEFIEKFVKENATALGMDIAYSSEVRRRQLPDQSRGEGNSADY